MGVRPPGTRPGPLPLSRRTLLGLGAGLGAAPLFGLPGAAIAAAPQAVDLERFLDLSARLTGIPAGGLDREVAARFLAGLNAQGRQPALVRLAAEPGVPAGPLADEILAAWYTGLYESGSGTAVASYDDALMWRALDFTKPQGSCGGETGYWALPPES